MAEPIKTVTVGGLTYNANHAEAYEEGINEKGQKMYTIYFNSGEQMTYPEQPELKEVKPGSSDVVLVKGENGKEYNADNVHEDGTVYDNQEQKYIKVSLFAKNNAKVEETIDKGWKYDDTYFEISNVMGATFTTSSKTVANVYLSDSKNCKIDLANNDSKWYGDSATIEGGKDNTVILDKEDCAEINGELVEGKGVADQKDYE